MLHIHIGLATHANGAALGLKHGDDLLRRSITEKLAQSFLVIGNAVFFHQRNKIGRRVTGQGGLGKVRIGGDKVFRTAMQVGKVAAPAARDEDLFADALSPLQYRHAAATLTGFNGAHKAGSSSAENDDIKTLHRNDDPLSVSRTVYRQAKRGPTCRIMISIATRDPRLRGRKIQRSHL